MKDLVLVVIIQLLNGNRSDKIYMVRMIVISLVGVYLSLVMVTQLPLEYIIGMTEMVVMQAKFVYVNMIVLLENGLR